MQVVCVCEVRTGLRDGGAERNPQLVKVSPHFLNARKQIAAPLIADTH